MSKRVETNFCIFNFFLLTRILTSVLQNASQNLKGIMIINITP